MKRYLFLTELTLILLHYSHTALAQKQTTFYLMPHAGIEWPISKFEDKNDVPSIVTATNMSTSDKYGISLLIDFKDKWNLNIGYGIGNIGDGIKWKFKDSMGLYHGIRNHSVTVRRGYLSISKPIKLIEIRKKNHAYLNPLLKINKEYAYWAVFDINLMAGASYEYIPPSIFLNQPFSSGTLSLVNSERGLNRYGAGIYTGFFFQFYKNNKKRLRIGAVYHQGLRKRLMVSKKVSFKGIEHPPTFQMFSRGSMVAIYIAYPIKLFSIKEKGTIKGL